MIFIATVLLCTCRGPVEKLSDRESAEAFPFISDGQTTKKEIRNRLGLPDAKFEDDRIWVYSVGKDRLGKWRVDHGTHGRRDVDVVLIFDPSEVLERHQFVRVR